MGSVNILAILALAMTFCLTIERIAAKLPDDIKKCKAGDKQCIINNFNMVLGKYFAGSEEMGLRQLDPLALGTIVVQQNDASPVNLNLRLDDQQIVGFKTFKVVNVKGFGKKPDGQHIILVSGDNGIMTGTYKANGKVLILPIQGDGQSTISMDKPMLKVFIEGVSQMRDGKLFMNVTKTELDLTCERTMFKLENLFNGDKVLGDNFNAFINENWRLIFDELKLPLFREFRKPLFEAVKSVFDTTPYTDIFET